MQERDRKGNRTEKGRWRKMETLTSDWSRVNIKRIAQNRVCAHVPMYLETTTDLSSSNHPTSAPNDIRFSEIAFLHKKITLFCYTLLRRILFYFFLFYSICYLRKRLPFDALLSTFSLLKLDLILDGY